MRKYEVDRVHNSKDDEIYQIAQSVEQKIRTGMLMPDYEIGQKAFHNWGDIILNYVDTNEFLYGGREEKLNLRRGAKNDWFESTCTVNELENDGKYYVTEFVVDHQNLKVFKNAQEQQITSSRFLVSFIYNGNGVDKPHIEYYNEDDDEWQKIVYNDHSKIEYNYRADKSGGNGVIVRIRCYNKNIRIRTDNGYLTKEDNTIKGYMCFDSNHGLEKGVFITKNKKWIYISDNSLHDVCVKHGGMKYVGEREKTIYEITKKNSKKFGEQGLMYYGYSKPRNGTGQQYQNRRVRKYRIGWIKCDWLEFTNGNFRLIADGKPFDEVIKLLYRRHKRVKTTHGTQPPQFQPTQHVHFIRVNKENNCFELWNFILNQGDYFSIKPVFLRTLSKDEAWKILEKKFAVKIINE